MTTDQKGRWVKIHDVLGTLYSSTCPNCGNTDRLTEEESKQIVHCQRCYRHYRFKNCEKKGYLPMLRRKISLAIPRVDITDRLIIINWFGYELIIQK